MKQLPLIVFSILSFATYGYCSNCSIVIGKVVDRNSKFPIQGAVVHLLGTSLQDTSESDGSFILNVPMEPLRYGDPLDSTKQDSIYQFIIRSNKNHKWTIDVEIEHSQYQKLVISKIPILLDLKIYIGHLSQLKPFKVDTVKYYIDQSRIIHSIK